MNKRVDWQVYGVKANGESFAIIVRASYGYQAVKVAKTHIGEMKVCGAMKVENFPTDECAECGLDVPKPYQPTHACVRI